MGEGEESGNDIVRTGWVGKEHGGEVSRKSCLFQESCLFQAGLYDCLSVLAQNGLSLIALSLEGDPGQHSRKQKPKP